MNFLKYFKLVWSFNLILALFTNPILRIMNLIEN